MADELSPEQVGTIETVLKELEESRISLQQLITDASFEKARLEELKQSLIKLLPTTGRFNQLFK